MKVHPCVLCAGNVMSVDPNTSLRPNEAGQLFAGWIVGIFIVAAMIIYLGDEMRRERTGTESAVYRELALNVAKAGFEQGLSFFRTHPSGCPIPAVAS